MELFLDILLDSVLDTIKLVPFLFITYLFMEWLSHRAGDQVNGMLSNAGKLGPVVGGALGIIPQCGFSAAASSFYAGRIISVGTLMAVYLATSDEMLPIMISTGAPILQILKILALKMGMGIVVGLILEVFFPLKRKLIRARGGVNVYQNGFCQCNRKTLPSAIIRTLQITGFIFLVTFVLGWVLQYVSIETISNVIGNRLLVGPVLSALIGLIPNCASSVMLTTLYLEGALNLGAVIAGLLTNAGVGMLVLFRSVKDKREALNIMLGLYAISVVSGVLINLISLI